jgi:hypothetical protein
VLARVVIGAHLHEEVGAGDDLINKKTIVKIFKKFQAEEYQDYRS